MHNLYANFVKILEVYKRFSQDLVIAKAKKRVEILFLQFDDQFNIMRNNAKGYNVFFTRIISKVSALTVSQYLNKINNRPTHRQD